jgi:hypothetical protein
METQKMEEEGCYYTYSGVKRYFKVAQRGYKGKGGRVVKKGDCILQTWAVRPTTFGLCG